MLPTVIMLQLGLWVMRRCDGHLGKGIVAMYAGRVKLQCKKLPDIVGGLELQTEKIREKAMKTKLDDKQ